MTESLISFSERVGLLLGAPLAPAALDNTEPGASAHDAFKLRISIIKPGQRGRAENRDLTWGKLLKTFDHVKPDRIDQQHTIAEFLALPQAEQDRRKDLGAFCGGPFRDGVRKNANLEARYLLTLDVDSATVEQFAGFARDISDNGAVSPICQYEFVAYSTRRHTPEKPKFRVVLPLTRPVDREEFVALSRIVAGGLFADGVSASMDAVDNVSFNWSQIMYLPAICRDSEFWHNHNKGRLVDPDKDLDAWGDWHDWTLLPHSDKRKAVRPSSGKKAENPKDKKGIVGAFCRAYSVPEAIKKFLPDIYRPGEAAGGKPRYTYDRGTSTNGAIVEDDGLFLFSHHGTDPCGERLVNAFDMVRLHLFGDKDSAVNENEIAATKMPSFKAMAEFAGNDPLVRAQMAEDRADILALYEDIADDDSDDDGLGDDEVRATNASKRAKRVKLTTGESFVLNHGGLFLEVTVPGKKDEPDTVQLKWVCGPLVVEALSRDASDENYGRLLSFVTVDGVSKNWTVPTALMAGDGKEMREQLASLGLKMATDPRARAALLAYIAGVDPERRVRCVSQTGWQHGHFVLPDLTVAPKDASGDPVVLQGRSPLAAAVRAIGTLESFKAGPAMLAKGNTRLVLAMCTGFAGPLLSPTKSESGGFHFYGKSSHGKTSALTGLMAVTGMEHHQWRATDNALESVAARGNDLAIALDEVGQKGASIKDAGQVSAIVYMLANGQGKLRADIRGGARDVATWNTLLLSSGEVRITDMIESGARGPAKAGQALRVVDIPADAERGMGILETLDAMSGAEPGDFVKAWVKSCRENRGVALREYLRRLVDDTNSALVFVQAEIAKFRDKNKVTDDQAARVADRFALVAAAGELATSYGITGWSPGEAQSCITRCFNAWLQARPSGDGNHEADQAIRTIRAFVFQNENTHFDRLRSNASGFHDDLEDEDKPARAVLHGEARSRPRVGWVKEEDDGSKTFRFHSDGWSEVCRNGGIDPKVAAQALREKGYLETAKGRLTKQLRHPGFKDPIWCYTVKADIVSYSAP